LRAHSATNPENGELAIFTNERWSDAKASTTYLNDILNDRLARVRIEEDSPSYFGITSNFVKAMNGRFDNTIIIMMGCDGLKTESMAEAFIQKGAKTYIGWDGLVTPQYVDKATTKLLEHLVLEKQTVSEAVTETVEEVGNDPYYESTLRYYPKTSVKARVLMVSYRLIFLRAEITSFLNFLKSSIFFKLSNTSSSSTSPYL